MDKSIVDKIRGIIALVAEVDIGKVNMEHPKVEEFGDYSYNLAKVNISDAQKEKIVAVLEKIPEIAKVEVVSGSFLNIWLQNKYLVSVLDRVLKEEDSFDIGVIMRNVKVMLEFAHPNTHKELHVGHMRTLIIGESLARTFEFCGAEVFRANYQGDIGPHVAKAIWGTQRILKERGTTFEEVDKLAPIARAHILGEGYVQGNIFYDENKEEIDKLNKMLYDQDNSIIDVYRMTRRWSLEYYDLFYTRFGTKFDKLYFESQVADDGKNIVVEHVGQVFEKSDGAIIFDGEKYGLHKRVFVTTDGNPTYEGKEMALAFRQFEDFSFDRIIHVVANEQTGYFQVVIKALEKIEPNFVGRQYHLPMGMVNLVGKKISSRTGEIVTVDSLLEEIKATLPPGEDDKSKEAVTMGAIKYAILKVNPEQNVVFDIKQSVSIEGNSGPYLQYTYARIHSVLEKSQLIFNDQITNYEYNDEELRILRWIYRFPEVVIEAATRYAPNLICTYLFELAQRFNSFYNKHSILSADMENEKYFRLMLTTGVGKVLKTGLELLGVEAIDRM